MPTTYLLVLVSWKFGILPTLAVILDYGGSSLTKTGYLNLTGKIGRRRNAAFVAKLLPANSAG